MFVAAAGCPVVVLCRVLLRVEALVPDFGRYVLARFHRCCFPVLITVLVSFWAFAGFSALIPGWFVSRHEGRWRSRPGLMGRTFGFPGVPLLPVFSVRGSCLKSGRGTSAYNVSAFFRER